MSVMALYHHLTSSVSFSELPTIRPRTGLQV